MNATNSKGWNGVLWICWGFAIKGEKQIAGRNEIKQCVSGVKKWVSLAVLLKCVKWMEWSREEWSGMKWSYAEWNETEWRMDERKEWTHWSLVYLYFPVFFLYSFCIQPAVLKKQQQVKQPWASQWKSGCNALQTLSREPTRVRTRRRHKSTKNEGEWRLLKQGGWRMFLFWSEWKNLLLPFQKK